MEVNFGEVGERFRRLIRYLSRCLILNFVQNLGGGVNLWLNFGMEIEGWVGVFLGGVLPGSRLLGRRLWCRRKKVLLLG